MQKPRRETTKPSKDAKTTKYGMKKHLYGKQQLQMRKSNKVETLEMVWLESAGRAKRVGGKKRWEGIHGEVEEALQPPPRPAEVNTEHHQDGKWLRMR